MALGPQVYKMVLDSRNFVDGIILTRRELQLQRAVLDQVRPAVENYGASLDQMAALVRKSALTVEEYNAANRALRAEFPENAAAAELVNAVMAEGESTRRSLMTADESLAEAERRHTDAMAANEQLWRDNAQTFDEYKTKLEALLAVSPDVLEAERARAEALRHGQEIARSVMTEEERFLEARQRADAAMEAGGLEAEAYARHLANLESQLPENVQKEEALREAEQRRQEQLREGAAIVDRNRTVEERLADERERATQLLAAKALTESEYERELRRINSLLPDVVAAERQRLELVKFADQSLASLVTQEDQYAEAARKTAEAVAIGAMDEAERQQILRQLESRLPSVVAEEQALNRARQDAASIIRRNMTETERLDQELARANELQAKGVLVGQDYERELRRISQAANQVVDAEVVMTDAERRWVSLQSEFTPAATTARAKLADLRAGYQAGKISQDAYTNGLIQLTATQLTGLPVIGQMAGTIAAIGPAGAIAAAAFATITAGGAMLKSALDITIDRVGEQVKKIDDLATAADTIAIPIEQFQLLAHAADMADIAQQEFTSGAEKMLGSVSKAADGNAKLGKVFTMLGLDAASLRSASAPELLSQITQAIDRLPNAADRVRASTAIFGSPDFLRLDTTHIERATELFAGMQGGIDSISREQFDELDDAAKELTLTFDETWKKVTIALLPAMTDAAIVARDFLVDMNASETLSATLTNVRDLTVGFVAVAREVPAVVTTWLAPLEKFESILSLLPISAQIDALGTIAKPFSDLGDSLNAGRELDRQLKQVAGSNQDAADKADNLRASLALGDAEVGTAGIDALNDSLEKQLEQLRDTVEYAGMAKEEIALLKLAEQGADQSTRDSAAAIASQIAEYERQAAAMREVEDAAKREAEAVEQAEKRRQDALSQSLDSTDEQIRKATMSERELERYKLAAAGVAEADIAIALAKRDQANAIDRQKVAAKSGADAIADLEKQLRQTGMTADERKLDDLRIAGVSDQDLAKIDHLQQELALREAIQQQAQATSFTIARGSKEEADAMAQAIKAAQMRLELARAGVVAPQAAGGGLPLALPPLSAMGGVTSTAIPSPPVVVAMGGSVLGSAEPAPVASVPRQVAPVQQVVPKAMEQQLAEQRRSNALLERIAEKDLTVEVEEVTL